MFYFGTHTFSLTVFAFVKCISALPFSEFERVQEIKLVPSKNILAGLF